MVYLKFHADQSSSMFTRNTKTLLFYVPIVHKPISRVTDGGGGCTKGASRTMYLYNVLVY